MRSKCKSKEDLSKKSHKSIMLNRKTKKCGSFTYFFVQLAPTSYGENARKIQQMCTKNWTQ